MIKYPGGQPYIKTPKAKPSVTKTAANRGMGLEHDLNISAEFYNESGRALITKRPTPINIVKVDYSKGARITDAYFEKQSTTDYNGIYRGKYIDFEAKSSHNKVSFPLGNIYKHQFDHLSKVITQGGLAFFIIQFVPLDETYVVPAQAIIDFASKDERKSLPLTFIKEKGVLVTPGYTPRLAFLDAVDSLFFK